METELQKVPLHVVDLAFALFASEYVEHDDLARIHRRDVAMWVRQGM